jgi:hypothetical protein
MFSSMIEEFVKPAGPHDLVMVSIWHSAFSNPIVLPLMKRDMINMMITAFESVTQSNKHPDVEDKLILNFFKHVSKLSNYQQVVHGDPGYSIFSGGLMSGCDVVSWRSA